MEMNTKINELPLEEQLTKHIEDLPDLHRELDSSPNEITIVKRASSKYSELSWLFGQLGKSQESVQYAEKRFKLWEGSNNPDDISIQFELALAYNDFSYVLVMYTDRTEDALEYCQKGMSIHQMLSVKGCHEWQNRDALAVSFSTISIVLSKFSNCFEEAYMYRLGNIEILEQILTKTSEDEPLMLRGLFKSNIEALNLLFNSGQYPQKWIIFYARAEDVLNKITHLRPQWKEGNLLRKKQLVEWKETLQFSSGC